MEQTEPKPIDRALMARDLERLAVVLAPLVEARLPTGAAQLMALSGLPPVSSLVADSLLRVLALSDDELGALIDAAAVELGAWRGVRQQIGDIYRAANPELVPAAAHLLETIT